MPSPKTRRKAPVEGSRKRQLGDSSSSFNGISGVESNQLRRPRTVPNFQTFSGMSVSKWSPPGKLPPRQPPKLLLNVTIQGSLGPLQLVMTQKNTVIDLVTATVRQYVKECRRPILPTDDPSEFQLHYSQFTLESLDRTEKLVDLGSRNFFLCRKKCRVDDVNGGVFTTPFPSSCCKQADEATISKKPFHWLKYMLLNM